MIDQNTSNAMPVETLAELRETLARVGRSHVATLRHYASGDRKGFRHNPYVGEDKASSASTVTCVSSLVRAGRWDSLVEPGKTRAWGETKLVAGNLAAKIIELGKKPEGSMVRVSAGLDPVNPFTLAFLAEGILDLVQGNLTDGADHLDVIGEIVVPILTQDLTGGPLSKRDDPLSVKGAVRIWPYPPSAYLTQLVYRVLHKFHLLRPVANFDVLTSSVRNWAKAELNRQMVVITMGARTADPMQLAYSVLLVTETSSTEESTPEEKAITAAAIDVFFSKQNTDGSWPPSQPLFHYPDVGNAQCFEYELLTQLLICNPLWELLLNYLAKLKAATDRLDKLAFRPKQKYPGEAPVAWASGHHPQIEGPESWSTASVYDFVHTLGRLVAEAVRRALFAEVSAEYFQPVSPKVDTPREFGKYFLDAELFVDGRPLSLSKTLLDAFVIPIRKDRGSVAAGGKLNSRTPMSAILFGPPGTSKTELAKMIAECVGWPLLSVDPSYLVQDGLDNLYFRANKLFSMLSMAEQVVAFLDEFDEMGRERTDNLDISSRFITTAMLPKLAAINKSRQIVIILATNYIANFDAAFSRGGRFDTIVQVMTPKYEEKTRKDGWEILQKVVEDTPEHNRSEAKAAIAGLTYLETVQLVARLEQGGADQLQEILKAAAAGTLARSYGPGETWNSVSIKQREHVRLPPNAQLPDNPLSSYKPEDISSAVLPHSSEKYVTANEEEASD